MKKVLWLKEAGDERRVRPEVVETLKEVVRFAVLGSTLGLSKESQCQ